MKPASIYLFLCLSVVMDLVIAGGTLEEGMVAFESFDYRKADKILHPLAEEGDAVAQVAVGVMYTIGLGKLKRDNVEALKWFHKAAEQGNADAGYYLGELYGSHQVGLQLNHAEAVKWYRWAAEKGHIQAQYRLGSRYFKGGEGLPLDYVTAYAWMDVVRRQGIRDAAENCDMITMVLNTADLDRAKALADEYAKKYIPEGEKVGIFSRFYQKKGWDSK